MANSLTQSVGEDILHGFIKCKDAIDTFNEGRDIILHKSSRTKKLDKKIFNPFKMYILDKKIFNPFKMYILEKKYLTLLKCIFSSFFYHFSKMVILDYICHILKSDYSI